MSLCESQLPCCARWSTLWSFCHTISSAAAFTTLSKDLWINHTRPLIQSFLRRQCFPSTNTKVSLVVPRVLECSSALSDRPRSCIPAGLNLKLAMTSTGAIASYGLARNLGDATDIFLPFKLLDCLHRVFCIAAFFGAWFELSRLFYPSPCSFSVANAI